MGYKLFINGVETDKHSNKIVSSVEINNTTYSVARYEYSIDTIVTNGTYSGSTSILADNGTATVTVTADSGYDLPSSITVTGASYTYVGGVISLSNPTGDVTISVVCEAQAPAGYEVELYGDYGEGGYVYVQINDDPTWYYAQMGDFGGGFEIEKTNIPEAYTKTNYYSIGIPNVSKIKIGTTGNPTTYGGPRYAAYNSTGDFTNLTFTSTSSTNPAYATSEITMTQDSKIRFDQDF